MVCRILDGTVDPIHIDVIRRKKWLKLFPFGVCYIILKL
jgi:hypothetical protein